MGFEASMCKYLVCGCIRVCSCIYITPDDEQKYQVDKGVWSPKPCRPWISSWFDSDAVGHPAASLCEHQISSKQVDDEDDGRRLFPTQAKRAHRVCAIVPTPITLPAPSHLVVGHPSLEIYRCRLPQNLLYLLDHIVESCTKYATSSPNGWLWVSWKSRVLFCLEIFPSHYRWWNSFI